MRNKRLIGGLILAAIALPANGSVMVAGAPDYGSYVQGHLALANGELDRAAQYFAGALTQAPDDPVLLRKTFDLAIAAGDEALAVEVAGRLGEQDRFDSGVTLLLIADAMKRKKWNEVAEATTRLSEAGFGSFIVPVIDAWTLEARGKTDKALRRLDATTLDGFAKSYVLEHRAHLLFRDRQYASAAALYDELAIGDEGRNVRMRIAAAAAWQAAKRADLALQRLESSESHAEIVLAKSSLENGTPIVAIPKTANAGVALLALRMSADLSRERSVPVALTLARIATFLAPAEPTGWLLTSELLTRSDRYDAALDAVRRIPANSPSAGLARGQEAALLARAERKDEALQILREATQKADADAEDWARLGDALQGSERFADAADAYARAVALGASAGDDQWRLHFLYGTALEQSGNWGAAEPALREAMRLQPADAALLNYLGYSLLDRGQSTAEARELIEKAHALAPDDGFITDSLGWAQFQAGEYAKAVDTLERAVASVPDDPVIAEHLGDAYWRAGRRLEARHRWQAALDSNPKPEQARTLAEKLDYGLDIALAQSRKQAPARP